MVLVQPRGVHFFQPRALLTTLDATRVRESLRRLSASKADIFGANGHRFLLSPPLAEADVLSFEQRHSVRLPADYRYFLTAIGNGGAGPYYGVFPLGKMDGLGDTLQPWAEKDGIIGKLSEPFPLTDKWNDLQGKPRDELLDTNEDEYWRQVEQFDARYLNSSLVNGAIPICHEGCALRVWLVVCGAQAGYLWHDGRSDCTGITPLLLAGGCPATFSLWYIEWLEEAVRKSLAT